MGLKGVGHGGPIQTLINRFIFSPQEGFIPALESLGVQQNLNSLDGHPIGVMYQPSNIREGQLYAVVLANVPLAGWTDFASHGQHYGVQSRSEKVQRQYYRYWSGGQWGRDQSE